MNDQQKFREINLNNYEELKFVSKIHLDIPALWLDNNVVKDSEIKDNINHILKVAEKGKLYFQVCEFEDEIVGYIWADIEYYSSRVLNIISLWTKKEFRNEGIASFLKIEMEKWAKENEIEKIVTTVSAKNLNMLKLNKELGYEISSFSMIKKIK